MLKRENRLTAKREIWSLQRSRPLFGSSLVLKFSRSRSGTWRFAVVVSTKVSKKAVVRNRIKRQIREAISSLMKGSTEAISAIVSAKRVPSDTYNDVYQEVKNLLNRARII